MYNIKKEKIDTIWRPTIFSLIDHTICMIIFIIQHINTYVNVIKYKKHILIV